MRNGGSEDETIGLGSGSSEEVEPDTARPMVVDDEVGEVRAVQKKRFTKKSARRSGRKAACQQTKANGFFIVLKPRQSGSVNTA